MGCGRVVLLLLCFSCVGARLEVEGGGAEQGGDMTLWHTYFDDVSKGKITFAREKGK